MYRHRFGVMRRKGKDGAGARMNMNQNRMPQRHHVPSGVPQPLMSIPQPLVQPLQPINQRQPEFIETPKTSLDFPSNVKDFLSKLDQLFHQCKTSNIPWNAQSLTPSVLECIFNVYDSRDVTTTRLSSIQKLQLADIICSYLSFITNEVDRQKIFNTLFYKKDFYYGEVPLQIMSLVTSLAIASRNAMVLDTIAYWMTESNMESKSYIARDIIKDLISDENPEKYDDLPSLAQIFTSILLIEIGLAYKTTKPPEQLVKQVITWIEHRPIVCFIPPKSAIFELFRWCMDSEVDRSRLNFVLLNAIEKHGSGIHLQVIPPVLTLIHELHMKKEKLLANGAADPTLSYANIESCTSRLFQLIQILISSGCLEPNEIDPIFEALDQARLPTNQCYEIMKVIYSK